MSTLCDVIGNPLEAVYNQQPMTNVSKRYEFFPTYKVMEFMSDHGFEASRMQGLARKNTKAPAYAKHLVTFRKAGQITLDDGVPELVFVNSHNRSSSAQMMIGFFRWACSNGCIFGQFTDKSRILHTSNNPFGDLLQLIEMGVQAIDDKIKRITDMKDIFLTYDEQEQYVADAARLRDVHDPRELMYAHRADDRSNNLWMTYNKAQEALLRGKYSQFNPNKGYRKARPIGSVAETVRINTELWKITERFLERA